MKISLLGPHFWNPALLSSKPVVVGSLNLACGQMLPSSRALYKNMAARGTACMHGPDFYEVLVCLLFDNATQQTNDLCYQLQLDSQVVFTCLQKE